MYQDNFPNQLAEIEERRNFSQDSELWNEKLNPVVSGYEAGALIVKIRRSLSEMNCFLSTQNFPMHLRKWKSLPLGVLRAPCMPSTRTTCSSTFLIFHLNLLPPVTPLFLSHYSLIFPFLIFSGCEPAHISK